MRESLYLEGNDQLIKILKRIPAFKPFSDESINKLLKLTKMCAYSRDEAIITEGGCEKCMYLLISGSVTVIKDNKTLVTLRRTGDIFGEMSLLGVEPRSASVYANAETSCLIIDAEHLETLEYDGKGSFHAAIYQMFAQILAYRLNVTTQQFTALSEENERLKKELEALKHY